MKLALVADWLPTFGGAEHVIAQFCELWPNSPLYTTVAKHGKLGPLDNADIRTSSLQRWYKLIGDHKVLLPWMPKVIERIDLQGYDVVLSSSHAVGKGVIVPPTAKHICYCHTPMRYAWEMEEEYLDDFNVPRLARPFVKKLLARMRKWDVTTAKRVDTFIANSSTVAERIERIYGRESTVILPPVDERFFENNLRRDVSTDGKPYYLALGRFVPYKRFDLLIEAANKHGFHLKIGGTGDDEVRLKKMAGPTVEFLGFVPDDDMIDLYANAKAFLFPQLEDAGVVPLEAQACGTPVIAYGKGGALDSVKDGETGVYFAEQTVPSLLDSITRFETMTFDHEAIRKHAEQFRAAAFKEKIQAVVNA